MFRLERAAAPRRVGWLTLLGLVLVPLVVAGGFLYATWNSDTRLDRVEAAIVNSDEPVRLDGQLVPLGRQLAGGLVNGEDGVGNFSWVLTDAEDAEAGLQSGAYAAVVTIPEDFSRKATSFSKTDAADIEPATLEVQTSQIRGIADTVVGESIAAAATGTLNTELTEQYLDNVYLGFNTTKKQFTTVADGARKLADGTEDLADGLGQTSDGSRDLADGLGQLDDGTSQLSTGAGQLSTGVSQLSTGLRKLADGTAELPSQTRKLANGAYDAADGAEKLADGAAKLDDGTTEFAEGTDQAAKGAKELATGVGRYADGVQTYASGAEDFSEGLQTYADQMGAFATMEPDELAQTVPCPFPSAEACQAFYAGFVGGTSAAVQGLADQQTPDGEQPGLLTGAEGLADGAGELSIRAGQIATGATSLSTGITALDRGADRIATGVGGLADGTDEFSDGLDQLADGTDQLADGLRPLAKGIGDTATGAEKLATGAADLANGTKELALGTSQSADGADQLSDGLAKLSDGGDQLSDGTDELADGLAKGADQVPTYDKPTRTALAEVVATPVSSERPESLFADIANTTYLAVVALWLGGLASFLVLRAIPSRVLTSMKPSWRLTAETLLPGAAIALVQATALTAVLQVLLDLDAGQVARLLPFAVLAGLAFMTLNHALVAWFSGFGRFGSVAVLVASAAAAITSAVPAGLSAVIPFLPMTPALEGVRAIVSGGSGAAGAAGLLLAWLLAGSVAGGLAIARHRIAAPLSLASARA